MRVVARLKQDRWTDADGKEHSRLAIVAEHVEFKQQLKKQDREEIREEEQEADQKEEELAEAS